MASIWQHIGDIRTLVKQTSDDSQYSDPFLYKKISDARAYVLNQELNKKGKISPWNQQTFCMKLELGEYIGCDCVPATGCRVMKTVLDVPRPLSNKYTAILKIQDPNGTTEYYPTTALKEKFSKYSRIKNTRIGWELINNKIVLFTRNKKATMQVIAVTMVAEDPLILSQLSACTSTGEQLTSPCYNLDDEYPMESRLAPVVYELVLKQLGISLPLPEDRKNDATDPTGKAIT